MRHDRAPRAPLRTRTIGQERNKTAELLAVARVVTLLGTAHVGTTGRLP